MKLILLSSLIAAMLAASPAPVTAGGKSASEKSPAAFLYTYLGHGEDSAVVAEWVRDAAGTAPSKIAWCGIAMAEAFKACGLTVPEKPMIARNWLNVGTPVKTPVRGDLVILWRVSKASWEGHVGIYWGRDGGDILILGGNQYDKNVRKDRICIVRKPVSEVLGYRRTGNAGMVAR